MTPTADPIAAIVVSHESGATIDDCLARLRAAGGVAQIRVIDNASQDGTLAIVQRHAAAEARVRIGNPDNPGSSVACNQGASEMRRVVAGVRQPRLPGRGGFAVAIARSRA